MNLLPEDQNFRKIPDPAQACNALNEETMHVIGRDFSRTAANIAGLVSLLEPAGTADPDFNNIRNYLSVESARLLTLVKAICI